MHRGICRQDAGAIRVEIANVGGKGANECPVRIPKAILPNRGGSGTWTDIQELLDLLAGKEITEFEMEQQGVKIRVRRGQAHSGDTGNANGYVIAPAVAPVVGASPSGSCRPK